MRRRTLWITVGAVVGVPILVALAFLLYLLLGDLSRHRIIVENLVSEALGRQLQIAGRFEPDLGSVFRITAGEVSLANAPWGSQPEMVSVEQLLLEVDLWSIVRPPVEVRRIELSGARVLLETSADGSNNWDLGASEGAPREPGPPPEIIVGEIEVRDVEITYLEIASGRELHLSCDSLGVEGVAGDMLQVAFDGGIEGEPVAVSGQLGPLNAALRGEKLEHDLVGRLGDAEIRSQGRIDGLVGLRKVYLEATVETLDVGGLAQSLGARPMGTGPFFLRARVTPAAETHEILVETEGAGIKAHLDASVASLLHPGSFTIQLDASGPDASSVGDLIGLPGLPEAEFSIHGAARCCEFPIVFDQVEVQIGEVNAFVDGVIGEPPQLLDSDLTINAAGPDLRLVEAITGLDLPPGSFTAAGRLVRRDDRVDVENFDIRLGTATLMATGTLGEPPDFRGIDFRLRADGADLSRYSGVAGVDLPERRFAAQGRLRWQDEAILLDGIAAEIGDGKIRLDGRIRTQDGLRGSELEVLVEGPDAAELGAMAGLDGLPARPIRIESNVTVLNRGYQLKSTNVKLGDLAGTIDGVVVVSPTFGGSDLRFSLGGDDASWVGVLAGLEQLPADGFRLAGRVAVSDGGYRVDDGRVEYLGFAVGIDGLIGKWPSLDETDLRLEAVGDNLANLAQFARVLGLPDGGRLPESQVTLVGRVFGSRHQVGLADVVVGIDGHRLRVDGDVQLNDGLKKSSLRLQLDTPDLENLGNLVRVAGVSLPDLPHEPAAANGLFTVDDLGYAVDDGRITLGEAEAKLGGRLGPEPSFFGTDVVIDSHGPNASLFAAVTGVSVPVAPFVVRGRFGWNADGAEFDDFSVRLGEYTAHVHGTLGAPPTLAGTALDLEAQGPGTGLIRDLTGWALLPDQPFRLATRFEGTPEKFTAEDFEFRLGGSDLEGGFAADLRGKPKVKAHLVSDRLDLTFAGPKVQDTDASQPAPDAESRRFSTEPLDLAVLDRFDADLDIAVMSLELPRMTYRDLTLGARLDNGRLKIDPLAAVGRNGGRLRAEYSLEPTGNAHRMSLRGVIEGARLQLAESDQNPDAWPIFDLDLDLAATGRSPHELAATADGWLMIALGRGTMDNSILDLVSADILLNILEALNPFSTRAETTFIECAVFYAGLTDGSMTLEPLALQTERMTLVGDGLIDLHTEELDLEWVTKPRKGLGLSASTITNASIRIGGTLTAPKLEMKGLQALTTTGAAVATGGLTLLAGGVWDRLTAERKVCKRAFQEVEKKLPPDRSGSLVRR